MEYKIRGMREEEYPLLTDFLYEAIYQKDEHNLLPRNVIEEPSLKIYIENFGLKHDHCLVAETKGKVVGAVWVRIIHGFGHVGDGVPELAVSLYKEFRGYGIGTELMKSMLQLLKCKGYRKVSLAVQKDNYAFKMYQNIGFGIVSENNEEYVMECNL